MMVDSVRALVDDLLGEHVPPGAKADEWDTEKLVARAREVFGVSWTESPAALREEARVDLAERLLRDAMAVYDAKEQEIGEELMRGAERRILLQFADQFWKDHLLAMDRLRDGVSLRGYGQRNPLLEYKKEGFHMFQLMQSLRDEAVVSRVLKMDRDYAELLVEGPAKLMAKRAATGELERQVAAQRQREAQEAATPPFSPLPVPQRPTMRRPEKGAEARLFAFQHNVGRNDPCPCGSGQKFKKCCYEKGAEPPSSSFGDIAAAAAAIGAVGVMPGADAAGTDPEAPPALSDTVADDAEADAPGDDASHEGPGEGGEEVSSTGDDDGFGGGYMPSDIDVLGGSWESPASNGGEMTQSGAGAASEDEGDAQAARDAGSGDAGAPTGAGASAADPPGEPQPSEKA
jgi:uncharacterized protein YecA (UPF0149 family)